MSDTKFSQTGNRNLISRFLRRMVGRIWRRILRRAIWKAAYEIIAVGQDNGACQIHLNNAKDELYRASAALDGEDSSNDESSRPAGERKND